MIWFICLNWFSEEFDIWKIGDSFKKLFLQLAMSWGWIHTHTHGHPNLLIHLQLNHFAAAQSLSTQRAACVSVLMERG